MLVIDATYCFFRILATTFKQVYKGTGAFDIDSGLRYDVSVQYNASRSCTLTFSRFYVDFIIHNFLAIQ